MEPQIRYARTQDGVSIAYWVIGAGPVLIDLGQPPVSHIGMEWEIPEMRAWYERFAVCRRYVRLDLRGTGLSDRAVSAFTIDTMMMDLDAVVKAVGAERVDLLGAINSGVAAVRYAARHPARVERLILWCAYSDGREFFDDPGTRVLRDMIDRDWRMFTQTASHSRFGWAASDHASQFTELWRAAVEPQVQALLMDTLREVNVADDLPSVQAPTLVLQRVDRGADVARRIAAAIPHAQVAMFEGASAAVYLADSDRIWSTIAAFLGHDGVAATGAPGGHGMAVILFTDIADSTALTERMGDAAFRSASRELDARLRAAIQRERGTVIEGKVLGDGVMAVFTSAANAISAALRCRELSADSELGLHLGIHAGDVLREGDNVFGGAVNIAARICGLSQPGELLVSDIVRGLARTSAGVSFEDRGAHTLKGIDEPLHVFAISSG